MVWIGFTDVEVQREAGGAPRVVLSGAAAARARELGIQTVHISMSHGREYATAHAIAVGELEGGRMKDEG